MCEVGASRSGGRPHRDWRAATRTTHSRHPIDARDQLTTGRPPRRPLPRAPVRSAPERSGRSAPGASSGRSARARTGAEQGAGGSPGAEPGALRSGAGAPLRPERSGPDRSGGPALQWGGRPGRFGQVWTGSGRPEPGQVRAGSVGALRGWRDDSEGGGGAHRCVVAKVSTGHVPLCSQPARTRTYIVPTYGYLISLPRPVRIHVASVSHRDRDRAQQPQRPLLRQRSSSSISSSGCPAHSFYKQVTREHSPRAVVYLHVHVHALYMCNM